MYSLQHYVIKVCQWLESDLLVSLGTPFSSIILFYNQWHSSQPNTTHINRIPAFPDMPLYICVTRVARRMPDLEQELPTLPEHLSSPLVISEVRVAQSLFFYVMFRRSLLVLFLLAIELSVLLQFTASDYHFVGV